MSFRDLFLIPLAGTPVEGPAFTDYPVVSTADFLHGDRLVRSVAEDDVYVVVV